MSIQAPETAQFYMTSPTPCPYLENREERKLFTHLTGRRSQGLHQLLADSGFRRSQNLVYRPSCQSCSACKSARVVVGEFSPRRRHRKIINANGDICANINPPEASDEQYELFLRYLEARHNGGGMTQMGEEDYQDMVEDTPVDSSLIEYRLGATDTDDGQLVGVALTDNMSDGYSMVYSFFDPELTRRGLGNYMILDHIERARNADLNYVYLGYWVQNSPKMDYKSQFRPLQVQSIHAGWQFLD
ncbi:MAG: arginyltransferase [Devosiaceae bacterium]|nr:arginyltransferase [Devosiaceae bacterium]